MQYITKTPATSNHHNFVKTYAKKTETKCIRKPKKSNLYEKKCFISTKYGLKVYEKCD